MGLFLLMFVALVVRGSIGEEEPYLEDLVDFKNRHRDIRDSLYEDRRGPINLTRNSSTRDRPFEMPTHKPGLHRRGVRYGTKGDE